MDRDGTKKGYDLDLTKKVSKLVNIPVIASGGVGNLEHLRQGIKMVKQVPSWQHQFFTLENIQYQKPNNIWTQKVYLLEFSMLQSLEELIKIIRERKKSSPNKSYTNKLLNDKKLSLDKVKEEINELIKSVEKNTNKIHEAADVIYHLLVYFESNGIKIEDVMKELNKRKK